MRLMEWKNYAPHIIVERRPSIKRHSMDGKELDIIFLRTPIEGGS